MNVNGEKLSKDIIQPLKPLKSKGRQKMSKGMDEHFDVFGNLMFACLITSKKHSYECEVMLFVSMTHG